LRLQHRGIGVLLVHRSGKSGEQRGTSRREDVLDTVIGLRRPEGYLPNSRARDSKSTLKSAMHTLVTRPAVRGEPAGYGRRNRADLVGAQAEPQPPRPGGHCSAVALPSGPWQPSSASRSGAGRLRREVGRGFFRMSRSAFSCHPNRVQASM
jgi:hypothetical protein